MAIPKEHVWDWLRNRLGDEDFDLLRNLVKGSAEALMDAEVSNICGAEYGERSDDRVNSRNGTRDRSWDTRVGTIDLEVPRLRKGSYYPEWLLDPRRRAEKALVAVAAECYVTGVSTRRVDKVARSLGIDRLSKSRVSEMAKSLDAQVQSFRARPLGRFPYVWLDALVVKCREGGRIVNAAVVVATGVREDGYREVLGLDVITCEDAAGWRDFLDGLVRRGLSGVKLVVSDAHTGLKDAIAKAFRGASWQRCRAHFMRNLQARVPKSAQDFVATFVRSIFAQPDGDEVLKQHARIVAQLEAKFPDAARMLDEAKADLLAFASFPKEHWRQIWSNNPQERLNREIRRRTDVVGIFPNRLAIVRLVGAVLAEQNDEWAVGRRYLSAESMAKVHAVAMTTPGETPQRKEAGRRLQKAA